MLIWKRPKMFISASIGGVIWRFPAVDCKYVLFSCLFTELADSDLWELSDGLFWLFLQKHSTNLAVLKKKFVCFYDFGSDNAANLLSCPETILHYYFSAVFATQNLLNIWITLSDIILLRYCYTHNLTSSPSSFCCMERTMYLYQNFWRKISD